MKDVIASLPVRLIPAVIATFFLCSAAPASADWDPGDPFKMHYPQLPDSNGWDVLFTQPKILADDWLCTETGPVLDVHFWFSSERDYPFTISNVHLSIHADIPASATNHSMPGALLWSRNFAPTEFTIRHYGTGDQGWYDPNTGLYMPYDHQNMWQLNIEDIIQPYTQIEGTIYWLDVTVASDVPLGWKTSRDHWNDDAVWRDLGTPMEWEELRDPITGESLDMAFVITIPEPSSSWLVLAGAAMLLWTLCSRARS